jgi:DNA-binding CsgD family transcriptional regulator
VYSAAGRFADLPGVLAGARAALDREGLHDMSEPLLGTDDVELLAWQGRWDEAEALAGRMIDAGSSRMALPSYLVTRGQLRVRSGRIEDGERDLAAVRDLRPAADPESRAAATGLLAEAAISRGDAGGALLLVDEALAVLAATDEVPGRAHLFALGLRAAADLAERSRARRDKDAEARAAAAAGQHADSLWLAESGRLVEGGANEARVSSRVAWGMAEEGRRTGSNDPDAWAVASTALEATGEPYLAAYARYREAEAALAGTTDRARAEGVLRDALAWAAAAGAGPLVRDIGGLARRARLDLEPAPSLRGTGPPDGDEPVAPDPYGLSPREREVLALLLEGRTNREIGERLFITEKTASSHVTHILDKLGVTSRGAAAALAARGGLVATPET